MYGVQAPSTHRGTSRCEGGLIITAVVYEYVCEGDDRNTYFEEACAGMTCTGSVNEAVGFDDRSVAHLIVGRAVHAWIASPLDQHLTLHAKDL